MPTYLVLYELRLLRIPGLGAEDHLTTQKHHNQETKTGGTARTGRQHRNTHRKKGTTETQQMLRNRRHLQGGQVTPLNEKPAVGTITRSDSRNPFTMPRAAHTGCGDKLLGCADKRMHRHNHQVGCPSKCRSRLGKKSTAYIHNEFSTNQERTNTGLSITTLEFSL